MINKFSKLIFNSWITLLFSLFFVFISILWSYQNNVILAYGDGEAHLNIAKRVVDSLTPGFSQLGGVWLPLPHILMLPFVWNNFLWSTGLAGSIVSGISFIWASVILYRFAYLISKNYLASFIAPLIFILNPNALYLATTPMSEILLFATSISSIYYLVKWFYEENFSSLIIGSFFVFLASLTRYDGWSLAIAEFIFIVLIIFIKKRSFSKLEGNLIVFSVLGFFGIFLWLGWNKLIFNNFLYFANSIYGSKAQQMWFYTRGYLPTYKDLPLSFLYYITDTLLILGHVIFILGIVATIFYLVTNIVKWVRLKNIETISLLLLFIPLFFYTISLYTGQASQILPPFAKSWYEWNLSNVRYGIHMLMPVAILSAYLARKSKIIFFVILVLILVQFGIFMKTGEVIAYQDGINGLSSQKISKGPDAPIVEKWMRDNYADGLILMDDYRRPIGPVSSGVPMNKFISVGNKPYWDESMINPSKYATWVVLQKAETDAIWTNLKNKELLNYYFTNVFKSGNIFVYKKKTLVSKYVYSQGKKLGLKANTISFKGVNIYDFLIFDRSQIDSTFNYLFDKKINLIRIWGFGKNGLISSTDLAKMDYILMTAKSKNIFVDIVFGNQYDDYGGRKPFLYEKNANSFYTNKKSIAAFENQIIKIINRKNTFTDVIYKDDPTIAFWELLNEPRIEHSNSDSVRNWVDTVGTFVSQNDPNHLISVGTEGFMGGNGKDAYHEDHGSNIDAICSLNVIGICSVHLYPKYITKGLNKENIDTLISEWKNISDKYNKPLYIGEVGFDLNSVRDKNNQLIERQKFFDILISVIKTKDLSGILLWNLAIKHDQFYSLSSTNEADNKIIEDISRIN